MRKASKMILPVLIVITVFTGCAREVYNISWEGVVADKRTHEPVPFAQIEATSIFQENIDETNKESQKTVSDENGHFKVAFHKGFGLTMRTSAPGYLSEIESKVMKTPFLKDTVFISRYPYNTSLVVRVGSSGSFSPSVPFVRESFVVEDHNKPSKGKTIKWGFDFLTGKNTTSLDSADLWVENNKSSGKMILNASKNGGIFPVFDHSSAEFLTSVTKAPETGYVKNHVFSGNESGFFIICRDGVHAAKIIPDKRICILNYKNAEGFNVKEKGIRFDYLFQPDTENRLSFPVTASAVKLMKRAWQGFTTIRICINPCM